MVIENRIGRKSLISWVHSACVYDYMQTVRSSPVLINTKGVNYDRNIAMSLWFADAILIWLYGIRSSIALFIGQMAQIFLKFTIYYDFISGVLIIALLLLTVKFLIENMHIKSMVLLEIIPYKKCDIIFVIVVNK